MRAFFTTVLTQVQKLIGLSQKEHHKSTQEQVTALNSLAPKILKEPADLASLKPYLENLKKALDTPGINNIAVTGSYGSGKSTLLRTFEHQNPQYAYLNISLASFKENKEEGDKQPTVGKEDQSFERKLEISILQQMFYHVKPSVIPDSRFKRIKNVTTLKLIGQTLFLILWVYSALTLLQFRYIEKLNPANWNTRYPLDGVALFVSLVFFVGLGWFIKSVYRILSNAKITKLNIKGEMELGEAVEKSVFNQHLEEILYFFERTDFNVVVIEDVDRFNSTDIFTKLREINILINNSNLIKRDIKFIYAIRDDMFKDKNERVKFFEFIIPVIPFINPSNAGDQLTRLISEANLQNVLSAEFTSDVVTFIDDIDMRLLINIFQEYQVYRNLLSSSLNQDNLFAILVYKNIYPDDFGDLAKRKGKLYTFLTKKHTYIRHLKQELLEKVDEYDERIDRLESEASTNIKELRALYIYKLVSKLHNFSTFSLSKDVSMEAAIEDAFFNQIKVAPKISYKKFEHSYSNQFYLSTAESNIIKFSSIEKEVAPELTYDQREQLLKDKAQNQIETLKSEKQQLKNRLTELDSLSIQEIFEVVDITAYLGDFDDSYLMRNLLLNGYIDEHYEDYISLFHEVSLTKDDFSFERSVKSGVKLSFDYKLSRTENLIKRLPEKYFSRETIYNFSLLESLIASRDKHKAKLDNLFKSLRVDGERQFQFIHGFIKRAPEGIPVFIKILCAEKPGLWRYIHTKSGLPDSEVRNLVRLIFEYGDLKTILKFEDVASLAKYFEELPDVFAFSSTFEDTSNLLKFVSEKNIRFKNLDAPVGPPKLFETVYVKNLYQINYHNIVVIIEGNQKDFTTEELNRAHYTTVLKLGLPQLATYISANIEEYITSVLMVLPNNTLEAEETIISLLNREDVALGLKEQLLKSQETAIRVLNDLDDLDLKQVALSSNSIVPTWENVFDYYDAVGEENFDAILVAFLNNPANYELLHLDELTDHSERAEDYITIFADTLLHCQELSFEAFSKLIYSLPFVYSVIRYDALDGKKIEQLVDKKVLTLSAENITGLKAKERRLSTRLIETHQDQFIEDYLDLPLDATDWIYIFSSSAITGANKLALIQNMDDNLIIKHSSLAELVCTILPLDKPIPLRYEVLEAIFKSNSSVQKKIGLLNLHFPNLDNEQIQRLTEKLGDDYRRIFMKQHKPVFQNTKFNAEFFTKLKNRDLIIRYELVDNNEGIRVFAKY